MENKFSLYRKIRYDRTYRPLGKMSWWRVLLGTLLLLSILFFTGIMSRPYAAKGDFRTAKILLITPAWMAKYHPDDLAYLDAGVMYQDGYYAAAMVDFRSIDSEAARIMYSRSALRLAEEELAQGEAERPPRPLRRSTKRSCPRRTPRSTESWRPGSGHKKRPAEAGLAGSCRQAYSSRVMEA